MKSIFGTNIIYTIFGESHSKQMGITITGLPAGKRIDFALKILYTVKVRKEK